MGNKQVLAKTVPIDVYQKPKDFGGKIITKASLMGAEGCGKTSLSRCLSELPFDEIYRPSLSMDFSIKNYVEEKVKLQLWDWSERVKQTRTLMVLHEVRSIILVIDMTKSFDRISIDSYLSYINMYANPECNIIMVATKDDLCDDATRADFSLKFKQSYPDHDFIYFSSKTGKGRDELNKAIIDRAKGSYVYGHREIAK
jgi:GTPase SAR1 family protein